MTTRITVDRYTPTDPRLGRHYETDSRSASFAVDMSLRMKQVDTFWSDSAPVLNQGHVGGCVGWTGADILNTDLFTPVRKTKNGNKFYTDKDGLAFYEAATHNDSISGSYPPDDTGSTGLGLAKALKKFGLIDHYSHAFTWSQFVYAIMRQPVAMGTLWTNQMFTPDAQGVVHVGPLNNSTIAGGHEYMARGISFTKSLILCRNHWKPSWDGSTVDQKVPGEFWLTITDFRMLLANQGDAVVLHGVGLP